MIQVDITKRLKTYNGFNKLEVNTTFPAHQITQIVGPSGAGKTTLLKIIAGLLMPEKGRVVFNEEVWLDISSNIHLPPQQRKLGFVFQEYALFPSMTVEEHLQYGTDDATYREQLLALGRLEPFKKHKPRYLSGGQQQRLALLRALSTRPRLLLMDEPFSALDRTLKKEITTALYTLIRNNHMTCLIVTHEPLDNGFADHDFELK